jgi:hypothetical protein
MTKFSRKSLQVVILNKIWMFQKSKNGVRNTEAQGSGGSFTCLVGSGRDHKNVQELMARLRKFVDV